ncbi:MAG: WD40/YVTN/BNR-like repeat-containing protein [bacterium]
MTKGAVLLAAAALCAAQEPATEPAGPVLVNTGKPMSVPFACAENMLRANGLTCPASQPCPVYLDLGGVEAAGNLIFVAGHLHAESATLESVLLASSDGGKTWREAHERISGAALDRVRFIDFENGWVSGQHLRGFARDAFFLISNDGGRTWRERPVAGESRAGAIERFEFDSKSHGVAWIDRAPAVAGSERWEQWETTDGGDPWTRVRVAAAPPETASRPAAWRIVPDARSGAFNVERRDDGRWQPVAGFLIRAGECREAELPLPPAEAAGEPK